MNGMPILVVGWNNTQMVGSMRKHYVVDRGGRAYVLHTLYSMLGKHP